MSRRLAESIEYETTLTAVAEQALPYLDSWCIVDVVEPDGSHRRLGIVHPDPSLQPYAERLVESWPPERDDPLGVPRAVLTRRTELIPVVDDEMLVRAARSEANLRDLRKLGIGSIVVVPLVAREQVCGAMTFVGAGAGRSFRERDVEIAEDLAARCAIAIDNARLVREVEAARDLCVGVNERLVYSSLRQQELVDRAAVRRDSTIRFLATMSHEVRTPISAIAGYAWLLAQELKGPVTEGQRQYLDRIRQSAEHLTELLSDLLDLEEIEEGRIRLQVRQAHLKPVFVEAQGMIRVFAQDARITVEQGDDGEGIHYLGDEDRVRQILLNLLVNAVKYTDEGGRVRVSCGRRERAEPEEGPPEGGPWVVIEVEDTGIGIPKDRIEDVFKPLVRLKGRPERGQEGVGLGLSISRDLARRMGGDLTIWSKEGEGSRFTLWLPAADGE